LCSLIAPQFAPEQVTTHFTTAASVSYVAAAAESSLRGMGFTAKRYPTPGGAIVRGWYYHRMTYPLSLSGGEGDRGAASGAGVLCVSRRFEITALAHADSTLVTIQPRRWGCNKETLLGMQEVELTRRLTERIKKAVNAETRCPIVGR
jgi:hypothetical protein